MDPGIRRKTLVGHGLFETTGVVAIDNRTLEDRDLQSCADLGEEIDPNQLHRDGSDLGAGPQPKGPRR